MAKETRLKTAVVQFQDRGTGLDCSTDVLDAAALGTIAGAGAFTTYVDSGLNVVRDGSNWKVTPGVAFILDDATNTENERSDQGRPQVSEDHRSGPNVEVTRDPLAAVIVPEETIITPDIGEVNDVYLKYRVDVQNRVWLMVGSDVSEPAVPSIQLATIDQSTEEVVQGNRYADRNSRINTVSQNIEAFEEATIPSEQTMFVSDGFTVDGQLNIDTDGELNVIE